MVSKVENTEIQFREKFDLMLEGIQIHDFDWKYLYVNDALVGYSTYSREDLLGHSLLEKYPGIEQSDLFKVMDRCMKERVAEKFETEFIFPDGTKADFELSIQPIPEGIFILSINITDRKKTEAQLKKTQQEIMELNKNLEEMVAERTAQLTVFKEESLQALRYAQRLQGALMQDKNHLKNIFPKAFILFEPKHIVSGDFFWYKDLGQKILIAVGDCTGHGVPGSLLTIMGLNILHSAHRAYNISSPPKLLNFLDEDLNRKLSHQQGRMIHDGMDITICEIDRIEMTMTISGANNPVYLLRDGEIQQFKTDKYSIGNAELGKEFKSERVPLFKGDAVYLFSDGFIDQFGGPHGKKFGSAHFRELLIHSHKEGIDKQESLLQAHLTEWQGKEEQTDDILVMGIEI
jgi:PAS domain S-box-containing protein